MLPMIDTIFYSIVLVILFFTAYYDLRYGDIHLVSPLAIWGLAFIKIGVTGGGLLELLLASTSGVFLFCLGLILYLSGSTGFGDTPLFMAIGYMVGQLFHGILFLTFTMLAFVPFFIRYIFYYWKHPDYDITIRGFLRKIKTKDLKEGMVLKDSRRWKGLKADEVETLKEAHGLNFDIWIKEGVPFAPAIFGGFLLFVITSILG